MSIIDGRIIDGRMMAGRTITGRIIDGRIIAGGIIDGHSSRNRETASTWALAALVASALVGCSNIADTDEASGSTSTSTTGGDGETTTGTPGPDLDTGSEFGSSGSTSGSSSEPGSSSGEASWGPCSPVLQDCPEGHKCTPYETGGAGIWDGAWCVEVPANAGAAGEACTNIDAVWSGLDTCGEGLMCWRPGGVAGLEGECVAFCTSSDDCPEFGYECVQQSVVLDYGLCIPQPVECDTWTQDCPDGYKCNVYESVPDESWDAAACFPLVENPDGLGEPCTVVDHNASGFDSCDAGLICWDVDPETLEGVCIGFCQGTPEDPTCEDPTAWCSIPGGGGLTVCLPGCDPLLQDCPVGRACYPVDQTFICAPDSSGEVGASGDPCEYTNVCDPGLFCAAASGVAGCTESSGCCTPFCDLSVDAATQCLEGQECVPWFEQGNAPPAYANVGGCLLAGS